MDYPVKRANLIMFAVVLFFYAGLFYLVFTDVFKLDFSSLYTASKALLNGENPYQVLYTDYFPTPQKLPANLNPPIVLSLASILTLLDYHTAVVVWSLLSFIMGLIGANFVVRFVFSKLFIQKNRLYLYSIYLLFYPSIMNTVIAQFGAILLFLAMLGYYFYLKKADLACAVTWGSLVAIKLFPALLFCLVLVHKRYKLFLMMAGVFLLLTFLPLCFFGTELYQQYLSMMSRVLWYGDNWNASLYGYLFRLFIDVHNRGQDLLWIEVPYLLLFMTIIAGFILFLKNKRSTPHFDFALTLMTMLLLSPFGWFYYFPLLILPLALSWNLIFSDEKRRVKYEFIWLLALFLLNAPLGYTTADKLGSVFTKLTLHSLHFYGLLTLILLFLILSNSNKQKLQRDASDNQHPISTAGILVIYGFSLFILFIVLVKYVIFKFT